MLLLRREHWHLLIEKQRTKHNQHCPNNYRGMVDREHMKPKAVHNAEYNKRSKVKVLLHRSLVVYPSCYNLLIFALCFLLRRPPLPRPCPTPFVLSSLLCGALTRLLLALTTCTASPRASLPHFVWQCEGRRGQAVGRKKQSKRRSVRVLVDCCLSLCLLAIIFSFLFCAFCFATLDFLFPALLCPAA